MYFFLIYYPLLGAGLKYIDNAFDEQIYNKKIACIIAPLLGLLWAYNMILDPASASILLAIVLGVLLKGKIDNYAHLAGLSVILTIIIIARVEILLIPLIILTISALLDEVGNDIIDKKGYISSNSITKKITGYFFDQRWLTKVAVLILAIMGLIPYIFFAAMILFDYAYLGVRWYSNIKTHKAQITLRSSIDKNDKKASAA
ncbi:MAG: hypothetical protein QXS02_04340, partial [Candidatus Thermoplasmatota archaeon]